MPPARPDSILAVALGATAAGCWRWWSLRLALPNLCSGGTAQALITIAPVLRVLRFGTSTRPFTFYHHSWTGTALAISTWSSPALYDWFSGSSFLFYLYFTIAATNTSQLEKAIEAQESSSQTFYLAFSTRTSTSAQIPTSRPWVHIILQILHIWLGFALFAKLPTQWDDSCRCVRCFKAV